MRKACLYVEDYLSNNRIFDPLLHRDNCCDPFIKLKIGFEKNGYALCTQDIYSKEESDIVIYASNMPKNLPKLENKHKSHVILSESAFIRPDNYELKRHKSFNKVFTWSDDLVDNNKYIKLNFCQTFPNKINKDLSQKTKLCVMIAGKKFVNPNLPHELVQKDLYQERVNIIRWYEKNQEKHFDLYGIGWNKFKFTKSKTLRYLNKFNSITSLMGKIYPVKYPSYRGTVTSKVRTMEKYWFSYCYENARDIPGYITEKIFDSFFSGCVPVYLGAQNISDYIPANTFIDAKQFKNYADMHSYIESISHSEYLKYLDNIENFLNSAESYVFRSECFVDTILEHVIPKRET